MVRESASGPMEKEVIEIGLGLNFPEKHRILRNSDYWHFEKSLNDFARIHRDKNLIFILVRFSSLDDNRTN